MRRSDHCDIETSRVRAVTARPAGSMNHEAGRK